MIMEFNNLSCFSLELLIGGLVGKEMRGRGTRRTGAALEGRSEVQVQMKRTKFRIQHNWSPCEQGWHILGKKKGHTVGGELKCRQKCPQYAVIAGVHCQNNRI